MEYNAQGYLQGPTFSGEIDKISLSPLGHLMIRVFDNSKQEFYNLNAGIFEQVLKRTCLKKDVEKINIIAQNKRVKNKWE